MTKWYDVDNNIKELIDDIYYGYERYLLERELCSIHSENLIKDAINQITDYVYGHDYILEQVVEKDIYKVLRSIDEMVKSDDTYKVFQRYRPLYLKLSNVDMSNFVVEEEHGYFG